MGPSHRHLGPHVAMAHSSVGRLPASLSASLTTGAHVPIVPSHHAAPPVRPSFPPSSCHVLVVDRVCAQAPCSACQQEVVMSCPTPSPPLSAKDFHGELVAALFFPKTSSPATTSLTACRSWRSSSMRRSPPDRLHRTSPTGADPHRCHAAAEPPFRVSHIIGFLLPLFNVAAQS
jgi:hypothetical protein